MDKDFNREFKQCPACSSKLRFYESLANELKLRGIARQEWNHAYDVKQGVILDQAKVDKIPIGAELPGYMIETDICMDCGMVYATKLRRLKAHKTINVPKLTLPGDPLEGYRKN